MNTTGPIDGRGAAAQEKIRDEPHVGLFERVIEATHTVRDVETMASKAARSQMYGMDEAQAFTLMMIAQSEGLHPIQAVKRYHIIKGRPSMRADAMQAEFQRHGGRLRWVTTTDEVCEVEAWHPVLHPEHLTFRVSREELFKAGVAAAWDKDAGGGKGGWVMKDMYIKFGRQMLRARAVSEMVRAIDPGIIVGTYTPEEIADYSDDDRGPAPQRPPVLERPEGPTLVHEPNHEPKSQTVSEAKAWVRSAISAANDRLHNALLIEGKGDLFKPLANEFTVVNHVVSAWIEDGVLAEAEILKPTGKRDSARTGAAFQVGWQQDTEEVKHDIWIYLAEKARDAAKQAGIELPDEEPALPPAPAGDGDTWEEGRE